MEKVDSHWVCSFDVYTTYHNDHDFTYYRNGVHDGRRLENHEPSERVLHKALRIWHDTNESTPQGFTQMALHKDVCQYGLHWSYMGLQNKNLYYDHSIEKNRPRSPATLVYNPIIY